MSAPSTGKPWSWMVSPWTHLGLSIILSEIERMAPNAAHGESALRWVAVLVLLSHSVISQLLPAAASWALHSSQNLINTDWESDTFRDYDPCLQLIDVGIGHRLEQRGWRST